MNWTPVAKIGAIAEDEGLPLSLDGKEIALFHHDGAFFATDNVCTHQYALLTDGYVEDGCVECPLHQAQFDLRTGEAKCAPATEAIRVYPTKVENDDIYVCLD
ncbi:MAG: non-heme iron oxygenase ferredoxin subunit [Pigmentiphaga sp.]